jgi:hypothetical protein
MTTTDRRLDGVEIGSFDGAPFMVTPKYQGALSEIERLRMLAGSTRAMRQVLRDVASYSGEHCTGEDCTPDDHDTGAFRREFRDVLYLTLNLGCVPADMPRLCERSAQRSASSRAKSSASSSSCAHSSARICLRPASSCRAASGCSATSTTTRRGAVRRVVDLTRASRLVREKSAEIFETVQRLPMFGSAEACQIVFGCSLTRVWVMPDTCSVDVSRTNATPSPPTRAKSAQSSACP